MRRSAHRSRPTDRDSGQIRLDFDAVVGGAPAGASIVSLAARRAARSQTGSPAKASTPGAAGGLAAVAPFGADRASAGASAAARTATEWFELGYELEATPGPAGSIDHARDAYQKAVETDDGHADAHLNLGRLLHEAGDLAGAERHYRRALEAQPDDATAAFNLGVVLEDLRRELQAIAAYERAMAADPDFLDAYHNVVRLHEKRGDKAAALRVLKRLRERTR